MKSASFSILALSAIVLVGCDIPGRPTKEDKRPEPHHVTDFKTLYHQNCRGCHGGEPGDGAAAIPLQDPLYLSMIPKERLREIIANGVPGYSMPGFALEDGGTLTDEQVEILTNGIYAWGQGATVQGAPPYAAPLGDAARGGQFIAQHGAAFMNTTVDQGPNGRATGLADPAFLGLVSEEYLRTLVIVGRPDLGFADYRTRIPGQVMTNEDISDVVAWLVSQRKNEFGQPLVPTTTQPQP